MAGSFSNEQAVFLNVPFDKKYQPLFVALIAGLTGLGRTPRCVLEVPSSGRNRLERIYSLISSCGASLHDLSRVGLYGQKRLPRFNMPFELGLAYSLSVREGHRIFLLEVRRHRIQVSLSDMNGHDPHIHGGTQKGILRCLLDCFGSPSADPSLNQLTDLTRKTSRFCSVLLRDLGAEDPFSRHVFRQTVEAAAELSQAQGLIR